ncbi:unnamed protein product [Chondrus crispus]|uniref:Uncharacterized protein n=1 Tax=Chondrus crispus TaxID=2769 RepID=R7QRA2_CHOCR|nr:unnamed protein product [Chondrus crispus]CDF41002.1 unnamed protein product [Chondrus crispus]|eukprot:XP_005711296.1 unnamed protein product [Chondrus crispus]
MWRASPSDTLRGELHPCSSRLSTPPQKPVLLLLLQAHAREAAGASPRARPATPSAQRTLNAVDDTTNEALVLLCPSHCYFSAPPRETTFPFFHYTKPARTASAARSTLRAAPRAWSRHQIPRRRPLRHPRGRREAVHLSLRK